MLLLAGSMLLLYTDGLVETRTDDLDSRKDEFASALAAVPAHAAPEEVCDALIIAMGAPPQPDDIALLALQVVTGSRPTAAPPPATP